ncbi:unnamed protein product [Phytomonas sp. EM1]|nr:unnamed protein product [Phytomonas sp. EM1]|eukprot:CCW60320.1 unnamed protein product [Phytomonas sp. isolate EM1]
MSCDCRHSVLEQQRVLRLLMEHRGVLLYDKTPSEENGKMVGVDWLDRITYDTIIELARRGDFFFLGPCTADQKDTAHSTLQGLRPVSLFTLIAGSAYHLLATEVEGDVRDTLHHVLMEFLFQDDERDGPVQRCAETNQLSSSFTEGEKQQQLERVKQRLEAFHSTRYVEHCLANALPFRTPFSASVRDEMPTFAAPVSCSQLLPRSLFLLPVARAVVPSWSRQSFNIVTGRCFSSSFHLGDSPCRQDGSPVRVLLLRLDPAGEWLPEAEDLYNTQTFFSYYSNDTNDLREEDSFYLRWREARGIDRPISAWRQKGVDGETTDEQESFYKMQARQIGTSECFKLDNVGYRVQESSQVRAAVTVNIQNVRPSEEEIFFEGLVDRTCTQLFPPFRGKEVVEGDTFHLEFRAAVRLFIWCLLHGVRIVLTPERVPPLFKSFGERYGCALQHHLSHYEGIWPEEAERSLAEEVAEESIIRIVDELRLECFERLLSAFPCFHEPNDHPERFVTRSTAILSRNRLRLPLVAGDALLSASECALTTVEAVLRRTQMQERQMTAMFNSLGYIPTPNQLVCVLRLTEPPVFGRQQWVPSSLAGSILITAPTRGLEQRLIRLLQKCTTTLLDIFHGPSHLSQCLSQNAAGDLVKETGVVRAGGAFFFSFHRCLRRQICALSSGHCGSSFSDLQVLIQTLEHLASACFAIPQQLARRIMTDTTLDHPTCGIHNPRGPRARECLWRLATQHAAELKMPLEDHELHVFLKNFHEKADMLLRSGQTRKFEDQFKGGVRETFCLDKTHLSNSSDPVCNLNNLYEQALRIFAGDLAFLSGLESMVGGKSSEDQPQLPQWMFVEAIEPNREAVRLALVACYLIAIAS